MNKDTATSNKLLACGHNNIYQWLAAFSDSGWRINQLSWIKCRTKLQKSFSFMHVVVVEQITVEITEITVEQITVEITINLQIFATHPNLVPRVHSLLGQQLVVTRWDSGGNGTENPRNVGFQLLFVTQTANQKIPKKYQKNSIPPESHLATTNRWLRRPWTLGTRLHPSRMLVHCAWAFPS